ncbi:MAG: UDP-N-acetylglucosamine diphosphorylase/glucosamine-1-phosphate N-acetyltransferase [Actinobacteria bacterium]|nr:UDP-N-acetylglucosamine diphosphorylase/glucosamine-1-phosphate N-acetyltransferase [Actinomycetota bacterium]
MKSRLPKVLHPLAGRPMILWALDAFGGIAPECVVVVLGSEGGEVRPALPAGMRTALQEVRDGTGGATRVGIAELDPSVQTVVVMCGDTPLVDPSLVDALVADHQRGGRAATMITAVLDDGGSYGRVIRDPRGVSVVEARDADHDQLAVREINAGLFAFDRAALATALEGLGTDNAQGEMYLPDVLPIIEGEVGAMVAPDATVVQGINTRADLAECEAVIQHRLRHELMVSGVTMPDPSRVLVDAGVTVGQDTTLWPGTVLQGATVIGEGCEIGPDVLVADSTVGDGSVLVSAHVLASTVGNGCTVGPFAYLRPGVTMEDGSKAGTYVEMKNTRLGARSKVPHLSYMGDADIGSDTNIGAGNITANYDGFRKHSTTVGSGVKTGSDCVLVAPVTIGDKAMTGAGSIITGDVPEGALGIARARQENIEGFTAKAEARAKRAKEKDSEAGEK